MAGQPPRSRRGLVGARSQPPGVMEDTPRRPALGRTWAGPIPPSSCGPDRQGHPAPTRHDRNVAGVLARGNQQQHSGRKGCATAGDVAGAVNCAADPPRSSALSPSGRTLPVVASSAASARACAGCPAAGHGRAVRRASIRACPAMSFPSAPVAWSTAAQNLAEYGRPRSAVAMVLRA